MPHLHAGVNQVIAVFRYFESVRKRTVVRIIVNSGGCTVVRIVVNSGGFHGSA
jgi:hypothetical protein